MKIKFIIKLVTGVLLLIFFVIFSQKTFAQNVPVTQQLPDTAKMNYNQISQQMKLYVYHSKDQSKQQQKKDEFECYKWAMEQSGIDPLNQTKVEAAPQETGPTGGAVVGAAKGAAASTAIGVLLRFNR